MTALISAPILAFLLGALAKAVRSDLTLPQSAMQVASAYLLLAIGLKGGFELHAAGAEGLVRALVPALAVGATIPFLAFFVLTRLLKFDATQAGALAAHYGSVSIVTFTYAVTLLEAQGVPFEGIVYALAVVLEIPGILVGLLLARRGEGSLGIIAREMLTGKSVILLGGGLLIGLVGGEAVRAEVSPFFVDP
ncbi:MAG: sodium-dependent bicarbonate transport family permease, partial [Fimbriimonadaceae bacterium]|nr:sodium-dependent bicarbonate transport family permease [Fimbriimonadaceae bacterium]